ncbi:N-acetylglucosamine-specific PTS transporter subunit IIBC [Psychrilyobacter atlanticus]|uniref:N-acetylglucosamine-specific PTS transporter subunit IIBC n=1 Tax=Psychrilyobacter atlanticus TaxID=271091 RepID=UPI00040122A4|nr:N-acetylglucosamine-specific PTS transporter subunit IIBC [Psychrilyobacter atlanticus]
MFKFLQKIGKAIMVPVAVLPAAAILMGIGYWIDPSGWGANSATAAILIKAGASIIDNIPILFAVGIAYGMSKDKNGAAALAGLVGFKVITTLLSPGAVAQIQHIKPEDISVAFGKINNPFIGILVGVISSSLYNKFSKVELHKAFSFFSGRRLVPILTAAIMIPVAFVLMFVWPVVFGGLVSFGTAISAMGPIGAGIYGFLNRLLIPVGLHHALNAVFWFDIAGINDLGNFWAGTGTKGVTGMYMAGFFPIMMFGLVGAAAAFVKTAKPENKNKVASIMMAAGFTTFFTGVTEPLEFAFMFLAPGLYLIHAVLTGISVFIAASMHWIAGFAFSGGLVDFILSSGTKLANKPYMLIVQGLIFMSIYYFVFVAVITKFDLKTPGREDVDEDEETSSPTTHTATAEALLEYLGGINNLVDIDNCATRLRLEVKDQNLVQKEKIKKITSGVLTPGKTSVQVIVGPHVEFVCDELKRLAK